MPEPVLSLRSVYFENVIQDFNLDIMPRDFLVVLGHNGSGKSTLFNLISQTLLPCRGEVSFCGQSLSNMSHRHIMRKILVMRQDAAKHLCSSMTIHEHLKLYLMGLKNVDTNMLSSNKKAAEYLAMFNPKLPTYLHKTTANLSGGEKQMLVLALNLLLKPSLLLLDEHTSALDPKTSAQIMKLTYDVVKAHNVTCLMTTHDMHLAAQYGNRLISLRNGSIANAFDTHEKKDLSPEMIYRACYVDCDSATAA